MAAFFDAIDDLPSEGDDYYYIDHFNNDDFEVFQTLHPENCSGELPIREAGTINYDISLASLDIAGNPVVFQHDLISPKNTGWLFRRGNTPIASGWHTSVNGAAGDDFYKIAGKTWEDYLDTATQLPWDPRIKEDFSGYVEDCTFGPSKSGLPTDPGSNPPAGLMYHEAGRDLGLIAQDILDQIFNPTVLVPVQRPPFHYEINPVDFAVPFYTIAASDLSYVGDLIQGLSEIHPGFDYLVEWDLEFHLWSPYRHSITEADWEFDGERWQIIGGQDNVGFAYTFNDDDFRFGVDLAFTNNGPTATRIVGSGTRKDGNPRTLVREYEEGYLLEPRSFRMDKAYSFSDSTSSRDSLLNKTSRQLSYDANPQHEIPLSCYPEQMSPDVGNFWTRFKPGYAIWIDYDLGFHRINSPHRIVNMKFDIPSSGEAKVDFELNQIYHLAEDFGVPWVPSDA